MNQINLSLANRRMLIILVDELDALIQKSTAGKKVVYNLFDWPGNKQANILFIAISNTIDLPERHLSTKITSRMGSENRISFRPYTTKEIEIILMSRLQNFKEMF